MVIWVCICISEDYGKLLGFDAYFKGYLRSGLTVMCNTKDRVCSVCGDITSNLWPAILRGFTKPKIT